MIRLACQPAENAMPAQQSSVQKTPVQTKLDNRQLAEIDAYRRRQSNPPTRAEAIRQLCTIAIRGERPSFEDAAA
jgi:hypothetical protein